MIYSELRYIFRFTDVYRKKSVLRSVWWIHDRVNSERNRETTLSTAIIRNSVGRATTTLPRLRKPRVFQRSVNDSWKNHLRKRDVYNIRVEIHKKKRLFSNIALCAYRNRSSV